MTIPQYTLLPMVVAQTDLIATVPGPVAAHFAAHHGLSSCPLPLQVPQLTLAQYWHERFTNDPVNRWIRRTLVGLFQAEAGQASEEALIGGG
jgi:DNA-binding transcriptional LysR family regulator